MIRNYFFVLLLLGLLSSCGSVKLTPAVNPNDPSGLSAGIDSIVVAKMQAYQIPGIAIGVVEDGEVSYTQGYGVKSINGGGLVMGESIFHTASISKLFTAFAVMHLVSEEKLQLDDKVVDLIPELKFTGENFRKVSIESLLNHTSGVPDVSGYNWGNGDQSTDALKRYIFAQNFKLDFEPGSAFSYSNLGYDLLGLIVERASEVAFEDYLKTSVLTPAGMRNSDFNYLSIADSLRTAPHTKGKISKKVVLRKVYPYNIEHAPSSTLNSSAEELAGWMSSFLLNLRSGNSESIYARMIAPSTSLNNFMGLGFQRYKIGSRNAVGHYGGDRGFRSYMIMVPEEGIGLVLLANCDYSEEFREEILHQVLELLTKE